MSRMGMSNNFEEDNGHGPPPTVVKVEQNQRNDEDDVVELIREPPDLLPVNNYQLKPQVEAFLRQYNDLKMSQMSNSNDPFSPREQAAAAVPLPSSFDKENNYHTDYHHLNQTSSHHQSANHHHNHRPPSGKSSVSSATNSSSESDAGGTLNNGNVERTDESRKKKSGVEIPSRAHYSSTMTSPASSSPSSPAGIVAFPDSLLELGTPTPSSSPRASPFWPSLTFESCDDDDDQNGPVDFTSTKVVRISDMFSSIMLNKDPVMTFTDEEFKFINLIKAMRTSVVGKINNAYYDEHYR